MLVQQKQQNNSSFLRRFTSPWDDKLKPNFQYRPLENIKINDIEVYENEFYFLTNNAVLSLSHGGNFYRNMD